MAELLPLALAFVAGVLLGTIFFGGLWWTVRRGVLSKLPALWFPASLLLRTSMALVGFYFVGRGDWRRLVVCLLGFVMARVFVTRLVRSAVEIRPRPAQEARHAS